MTMFAQLYYKIQITLPLFNLIYFVLSWIFIFFFILFSIYHGYYKKNYNMNDMNDYNLLTKENDLRFNDEHDDDLLKFIK